MRVLSRVLVLPLVFALGCTTQEATPDSAAEKASDPALDVAAVQQAIEANNERFAAALEAGDIATAVAIYAPDAVVMLSEMPAMRGEAAIREGFQGWLSEVTVTDFALTTGDVMVADDLAIETGTYTMTVKPKTGAASTDKGKFMTVWKRQPDGTWKLIRDIANSDLPAQH